MRGPGKAPWDKEEWALDWRPAQPEALGQHLKVSELYFPHLLKEGKEA